MGYEISVIVPVYNVEMYLAECLDSIVDQMPGQIEIILIDDGSTDSSGQIADDYAAKYDFIQVHHTPNGGLSKARNIGVEYATGEYITFVDSDDVLDPLCLVRLYNRAVKFDAEVVVGNAKRFDEDIDEATKLVKISECFKNTPKDRFVTTLEESPYLLYNMVAWDKLIRRDFYLEQGTEFPEGYKFEDEPTMLPLLYHAKRIGIVRYTVYYWRYRQKTNNPSITQSKNNIEVMKDAMAMFERIATTLENIAINKSYSQLKRVRAGRWINYDFAYVIRNLPYTSEEYQTYILSALQNFYQRISQWVEFDDALTDVRPIVRLETELLINNRVDELMEMLEYHNGEYNEIRLFQTKLIRMYVAMVKDTTRINLKFFAAGNTLNDVLRLNGMGIYSKKLELAVLPRDFSKLKRVIKANDIYDIQFKKLGLFQECLLLRHKNDNTAEIIIVPDRKLKGVSGQKTRFEYAEIYT